MNLKQAGILGFYAGLVVGGGVAAVVTKRRLRYYYDRLAEKEIAQAREFYERKYKTKSPSALLEELHPEDVEEGEVREAIQKLGYSVTVTETEEKLPPDPRTAEERQRIEPGDYEDPNDTGHVETRGERELRTIHGSTEESFNVFRQRDKDLEWDQEHEDAYRQQMKGSPYVISEDEWIEHTPQWEQISLTYWDEDDVLAESHGTGTENHIPDPDSIVGVENLDKFGYGSGDPSIVYVRNEKLGSEYEIVLQHGSYAKTVLGFDDDLKHADRPKNRQLRRFRE